MKLTILGAGNAGCVTLLHFSYYRNFYKKHFDIELIYSSKIDPVPVGQGSNINVSELVWNSLGINVFSKKNFSFTLKHGILYENWGKKQKEFFHPFAFGTYSFHQEPAEFQKFVLENVKNVTIKDEVIKSYDDIDSDFIIDCRGTPKDLTDYHQLINPLNHVLLSTLPPEDYTYTKSIATPDGWCFHIPLKNKVSVGYNFNSNITSIKDAEENFKKLFNVEKIINKFEFKQYLAKKPIINKRVALNGNKLFFLEPLEATAIGSYIAVCRALWDYMFGYYTIQQSSNDIKDYMFKIQNFILWHYAYGSIYNTNFWDYSKKLYENNKNDEFLDQIKFTNDKSYEYLRNPHFSKQYSNWPSWSIKMWNDYVN